MSAPHVAPSREDDATLGSPPGATPDPSRADPRVRLGVGTQLSMGFVAVAVLGLTANLLLQGGNTAVRTRVERIAPDASLLAPAAIAAVPLRTRTDTDPVPQDVKPVAAEPTETPVKRRPARVTRAAPSPEALVATLAEFDRRILANDIDIEKSARPTRVEAPALVEDRQPWFKPLSMRVGK